MYALEEVYFGLLPLTVNTLKDYGQELRKWSAIVGKLYNGINSNFQRKLTKKINYISEGGRTIYLHIILATF